jgi:hypothetical protein
MRGSYQMCLDELAAHGRAPLARQSSVGARRAAPGGLFAKSFSAAGNSHGRSAFDELIDELHAYRQRRDARRANAALAKRVAGRTSAGETFANAAAGLDAMFKSQCVKPILMVKRAAKPASTIAKAFGALQSDVSLTADQRGRLMLGISGAADRFAKSQHPMLDRIDEVRAKLDAALASGHAGRAEPLIQEALKLINSGRIEGADHARLSLLLSETRREIEEAHNGSQG